jgi:hypothetical protein
MFLWMITTFATSQKWKKEKEFKHYPNSTIGTFLTKVYKY